MNGERDRYLRAILEGNRNDAMEIALEAHRRGRSVAEIYVDVFQEALYEVGRLWEGNRITVAEEHRGTAITQFVMAGMYPLLDVAGEERGRAVITGIDGELHQVGGNMVADLLESRGWNVRFLGSDVPPDAILKAIRDHRADLLGISATMYFNLPQVVALVAAVRREFGAETPRILLGGGAFRSAGTAQALFPGCLIPGDLHEAMALVDQLPRPSRG